MYHQPTTRVPGGTTFSRELSRMSGVALPLAGAYLAELAMYSITKVVVGRLGYVELAATGLSGDITFEILAVLFGYLSIIGVMVAEADGAEDRATTRHRARQGFIVATLLAIPGTILIWNLDLIFPHLGQRPEVVALTGPFLAGVAPSALPLLWFTALRNVVSALNRARAVLMVTLAAVALNTFLAYALILGSFGFPALGLFGAGLAISISTWAMFLGLVILIRLDGFFAPYQFFDSLPTIDWPHCRSVFRLGLPVAGIVILEGGLFAAVALLMGSFGAEALATNNIVFTWIATAFVLVLGLSEAVMVRVARWTGVGDRVSARRAGLIGIGLTITIMSVLAIVPLVFSEQIVAIFLEPDDPALPAIMETAASLFIISAFLGVFDGLQAVASRALRGLRDTLIPMWIAAVGYWLVGIGGGVLLAFEFGFGPSGLWMGLAGGLMVTGVILTWRFIKRTRIPAPDMTEAVPSETQAK